MSTYNILYKSAQDSVNHIQKACAFLEDKQDFVNRPQHMQSQEWTERVDDDYLFVHVDSELRPAVRACLSTCPPTHCRTSLSTQDKLHCAAVCDHGIIAIATCEV